MQRQTNPLREGQCYAIVTKNVEKTTKRPSLSTAALARHGAGLRSRARPCDCRAHAPGGSTGVCVERRDDGKNARRNLGSACATGSLDPGKNPAQHPDVRRSLDADRLLAGANGKEPAAYLLRSQRLSAASTPDRLPVYSQTLKPEITGACALDRRSHRPIADRANSSRCNFPPFPTHEQRV